MIHAYFEDIWDDPMCDVDNCQYNKSNENDFPDPIRR